MIISQTRELQLEKIIHYRINEIENNWMITTIPNETKANFNELNITSKQLEENLYGYNIPDEVKNPEKHPNDFEVMNFFKEREGQKITYREIVDNLYKNK